MVSWLHGAGTGLTQTGLYISKTHGQWRMAVVGVVVGDGVGPVGVGVVSLTSHSPNTLVSKESIRLLKSSILKTFLSLDATR